jgi:signal transduction histidine kinase
MADGLACEALGSNEANKCSSKGLPSLALPVQKYGPIGLILVNNIVSLALMCLAMFTAWHAYAPIIAAPVMQAWFVSVASFLALWLVASFVFVMRKPDVAELNIIWQKVSLAIAWGCWLSVLGIIWLFMPKGDTAMQLMTIIFSNTYVVLTVLATPSVGLTNRFFILGTGASLAAVAYLYRIEMWQYLVPYLMAYAAAMVVLSQTLRNGIRAREDARHIAESERDTRTRFLASASHDLGQPLQAARLFFDQALRGGEPKKREKAAADARNALGSMERLLRQMLDHLRLEAGTVTVRAADISVGSLIGKVASQFAPVAALAEVSLIAVPSQFKVRGDADLVERALGNLVDNALRHAHAKRVLIGARHSRNRVRFWVIDDGAGVAKADVPRLFEDYTQGSDHGDDERGGFGLGLASVRRFAGLMNGYAGIEGKWRHGSAFFLDLPASGALASP